MHLLVPGPDSDKLTSYNLRMEARRKKRQEKKAEQQRTEQHNSQQQPQVQADPWKFLDNRTAGDVGNCHSTKQVTKNAIMSSLPTSLLLRLQRQKVIRKKDCGIFLTPKSQTLFPQLHPML